MQKHLYAFLIPIALVFAASTADAATGKGTATVRKANGTVSKLLKRKAKPGSQAEKKLAAQVQAQLRDFLDVEELGKRALQKHWATLTQAQQADYQKLLRELIEKNYIKGMRARVDYKVNYTGETAKGADLLVSTEIITKRNGRPYKIGVDYVLRKDGRSWRAFDVVTEGVGLVENYAAMFNKIIAKDGFDGLLSKMRKKLASI